MFPTRDETFTVTLSSPTGGITLGSPTTNTVTITNVAATTAAFSASTTSVDEGAMATLTVNRSGGTTAGTVNYTAAAGTATAGSDYTAPTPNPGTLSFAVGETSKTISVPVLFDGVSDSGETFTVTLSSPTGGITLGSPTTNTVTITNIASTPGQHFPGHHDGDRRHHAHFHRLALRRRHRRNCRLHHQ